MEPISQMHAFMTLWEKPSFEAAKSWSIYTADSFPEVSPPKRVAVRRLTSSHRYLDEKVAKVLRSPDYEILASGSYGIRVSQTEVPIDKFLALINWGKSFTIPIWGMEFADGFDGTSYAIELWPECGRTLRLEWWEGFPREWTPLIKWASEIRAFLEMCLRSPGM